MYTVQSPLVYPGFSINEGLDPSPLSSMDIKTFFISLQKVSKEVFISGRSFTPPSLSGLANSGRTYFTAYFNYFHIRQIQSRVHKKNNAIPSILLQNFVLTNNVCDGQCASPDPNLPVAGQF